MAARSGIEIRVGLATLLGRDERPGEIPGLGPVLADVARTAVAAQRRGAEWRFAIVDEQGYLLLAGLTRRRPHHPDPKSDPNPDPQPLPAPVRGGIVELHLSETLLAELAADPASCGQWAGVVADIAGQYARREQLVAALDGKPHARFARGALARHIQVRDRTCTHPGCTRPATEAELDHTHDHAAGGPTTAANIGPGCTRHHWFKTALGWRLRQPRAGHYEWTSPLGHSYQTRGEPVRPDLPDPLPRPRDPEPPDPTFDPGDWQPDLPILYRPLIHREPPRPPPPPTARRRPAAVLAFRSRQRGTRSASCGGRARRHDPARVDRLVDAVVVLLDDRVAERPGSGRPDRLGGTGHGQARWNRQLGSAASLPAMPVAVIRSVSTTGLSSKEPDPAMPRR